MFCLCSSHGIAANMTKVGYPGIGDPVKAFEDLRPLVDRLRALQRGCRPFGRDYHAIAIALDGLDSAAYHFTRRPHFYSAGGRHQ
jgi:hypothetical protein